MEEGLTIKELIKELQKLPEDEKIYVNRWYERKGSVVEWRSYLVRAMGIKITTDINTNKELYSIETECIDLRATINNFMEKLDNE